MSRINKIAGVVGAATRTLRIATTSSKLPRQQLTTLVVDKNPFFRPYQRTIAATLPSMFHPTTSIRALSSHRPIPNQESLVEYYDLITSKNISGLFAHTLSMESKELPTLYLPDRVFTVMDLYILLKSDYELLELSERAQDPDDPLTKQSLDHYYKDFFASSKIISRPHHVNMMLFNSIASGESVGRILENCVKSYYLTNSLFSERQIGIFIAKLATEAIDDISAHRKVEAVMSKYPPSENPKTKAINDIMDMSTRVHRLNSHLSNVQKTISQVRDPKSPTSTQDFYKAKSYLDAYKFDFEFMLRRIDPENKAHTMIEVDRINPVLHLYLESPESFKLIRLLCESLRDGDIKDFRAGIQKIEPQILKRFLNEHPLNLETFDNFTSQAFRAGTQFIESMLDNGWDPNPNHCGKTLTPYSSPMMVAIMEDKDDMVKILLERGFERSKSQFLVETEVDPLVQAIHLPGRAKIKEMLQEHYNKPNPTPLKPISTTLPVKEKDKRR